MKRSLTKVSFSRFDKKSGNCLNTVENKKTALSFEFLSISDYMNYQYFVQIVPTDIQTLIGSWPAFQYSVKEQAREVGNYAMGSSGIPGKLFCKCFMCPT